MLTITEGAEEALALLRDSIENLPEGGGVRITRGHEPEANGNGDDAFALMLVAAPEDGDVVLDGHALPMFVEPSAAEALEASALDGHTHGDHVHFAFVKRGEE